MATFKAAFTAKFQTTKDGDIEETHFASGDAVSVVQTWENFYLVKDDNGHYYNVPKQNIEA